MEYIYIKLINRSYTDYLHLKLIEAYCITLGDSMCAVLCCKK